MEPEEPWREVVPVDWPEIDTYVRKRVVELYSRRKVIKWIQRWELPKNEAERILNEILKDPEVRETMASTFRQRLTVSIAGLMIGIFMIGLSLRNAIAGWWILIGLIALFGGAIRAARTVFAYQKYRDSTNEGEDLPPS